MLGPEDVHIQGDTLVLSDLGKMRTGFYDFEAKKDSTLILVNKSELMNREVASKTHHLKGIKCHLISVQRGECYTSEGSVSLQT